MNFNMLTIDSYIHHLIHLINILMKSKTNCKSDANMSFMKIMDGTRGPVVAKKARAGRPVVAKL